MKKKGFTLIELLAVIVILAIIAVIATPIILGIVENTRKEAFQRSVELVEKATALNVNNKIYEDNYTYTLTDGVISDDVAVNNTEGMNGSIIYDKEGNVQYAVHNDKWCVVKSGTSLSITEYSGICDFPTNESCFAYREIEGGIEITNYYDYENNDSNNSVCPKDVIMPNAINGLNVIKIGDFSFMFKQITSIEFPNSLETIGGRAFGMNKLSGKLDLSNTQLTSIGEYAFEGSTNQITSIKFPSSLESIGNGAFQHNKLSGELDLSNTKITSIGDAAFTGNYDGSTNQITSIKLPSSLESIGQFAFSWNKLSSELDLRSCTNLKNLSGFDYNEITNIKLPSSLETIGEYAFSGNKISDELDLSNLTNLKDLSGFDYNEITNIKFPKNLNSIGNRAFEDNKISGELDLSDLANLTSIGVDAFGGSEYRSTNQITSIKFPSSLESIGSNAFENNKLSGELDLSNTQLTSIEYRTFFTNQITSVKFPSSLTTIKGSAFRYNSLESVTFYGRSNLEGITIGTDAWGWATDHDKNNSIFFNNVTE